MLVRSSLCCVEEQFLKLGKLILEHLEDNICLFRLRFVNLDNRPPLQVPLYQPLCERLSLLYLGHLIRTDSVDLTSHTIIVERFLIRVKSNTSEIIISMNSVAC